MAIIQDGTSGSILAAVSASLKALRVSQHPIDTTGGGAYSCYFETGAMAAALAANSEIVQFRNPNAAPCIVERCDMVALYATTGFTAGIGRFRAVVARSWTVDGTGGANPSFSGDNNQLRQTHAAAGCTIRVSTTTSLGVGTKTLDASATTDASPFQSLNGFTAGIGTGTNVNLLPSASFPFFDQLGGHPLILAQNEGFVIKATVPATGVWTAAFTIRWTEATTY